jgi:hypothetical protein
MPSPGPTLAVAVELADVMHGCSDRLAADDWIWQTPSRGSSRRCSRDRGMFRQIPITVVSQAARFSMLLEPVG